MPKDGRSPWDEGYAAVDPRCRLDNRGTSPCMGKDFMGKNDSIIRRMCVDGMLVGLFVVLTLVNIKIGPMVRISFGSLPVVFASLLFGPLDGFIVACIGEFVCQVVNYGFSLTTVLWVLVPGVRALFIGFISYLFKRKGRALEKHLVWYFATLIVASLLVTLANTGVSFLDAYLYEYPFTFVWLTNGIRALISLATAVVIGLICIPLVKAIGSLVYPGRKQQYKK